VPPVWCTAAEGCGMSKRYTNLRELCRIMRYEWGHRRAWHSRRALLYGLYWTFVRRYPGELCQDCGCPGRGFIWHSPNALYIELTGGLGGLCCPECFDKRAKAAGIWLTWTPMVCARRGPDGERHPNSNWWQNETRDDLMMGEPDPDFWKRDFEIPQPPWDRVRAALQQREITMSLPQIVHVARCPEHGLHGCRTECHCCGGPVEQVPMVEVCPGAISVPAASMTLGRTNDAR
jgi:hypothetical protein